MKALEKRNEEMEALNVSIAAEVEGYSTKAKTFEEDVKRLTDEK